MNNKINVVKDILWFFIFFAVVAGIFRLWFGLGATTNLTDEVPWGLWKVLNMIAGVALSTCGFTLGFLVYVLKLEKFKPLIKPAILIAFLGYGSSCFALLFDIGLPDRFWHPFFMWNEHSFLFEVFWCVILYFTVTFIELMPNILERFKAKRIVDFLHKIATGVVIVGISLSSLHHSSLGSLFLVTPQRLHSLWYSSLLPLLFFVSAAGCGIMFLIFVKILYARWYNPVSVFGNMVEKKSALTCSLNGNNGHLPKKIYGKEMSMLGNLGIIAASLLGAYLLLKIYDLFANGSIEGLLAGTWESWLYIVELIATSILPILLIVIKKTRKSPYGLGTAAFSASFGLALNRMNVGIFGYFRDAGTIYIPSFTEWALSIGIVAGAVLVFLIIVENFSIFDDNWKKLEISRRAFKAAFDSISRVWQVALHSSLHRITLMGILVLPFAFVFMYPLYSNSIGDTIIPAKGIDVTRSVLQIDGNQTGMRTEFRHIDHQNRLGGKESCTKCHHMSLPNDQSTPCSRCHRSMLQKTKIFAHTNHTTFVAKDKQLSGLHSPNFTCTVCHSTGMPKTNQNAKSCMECHKEDMNITDVSDSHQDLLYADSYMDVMHKVCVDCHREQQAALNKQNLSHCSTCHKTMSQDTIGKNLITETQINQEEKTISYNK